MADQEPIFTVTDRWGDLIVLTQEDWGRISAKHPGIEPYVDEVRRTLERPNIVYEGRYPDSKVFYAKDLLSDIPSFWGCYVAVIVRYSKQPATIRTVYFPFNIEARLGTLLYMERG